MGRQNYEVSAEEFVRAWQQSSSVDEVAEKLGMPKPIVLARASTYRQKGVKLKAVKRGAKGLDVDTLNAIIDELNREQAGTEGEAAKGHPARRTGRPPDG
jgi:hypothetical protein